jgi:hypothetical protein
MEYIWPDGTRRDTASPAFFDMETGLGSDTQDPGMLPVFTYQHTFPQSGVAEVENAHRAVIERSISQWNRADRPGLIAATITIIP